MMIRHAQVKEFIPIVLDVFGFELLLIAFCVWK